MSPKSGIEKINFQHEGIGSILRGDELAVPLNQREYSWQEEHVQDLFNDFEKVINKATYFLGTVVITRPDSAGRPEVTDGQQRLATTTILLAAIRDYLFESVEAGNKTRAQSIEQKYLKTTEFLSTETVPRLKLNVDDNEFFTKYVLASPDSDERQIQPRTRSHDRIKRSAELAKKQVSKILASSDKESQKIARLAEWVEFIDSSAQVIVLQVPDHINAFVMFETLNDSGLRASQADLLKNYLLSLAGNRMREAQQKWAQMVGTLESAPKEDVAVTYLHHLLITKYGPLREREVFDKVKNEYNTEARALEFLEELRDGANDYVALSSSDHSKWNEYGTGMRKSVAAMHLYIRVEQIKPLMFAVAKQFSKNEAKSAFKFFVNLSVRFLIVGGRGGLLERAYAIAAQKITEKSITTAAEIKAELNEILPTDTLFEFHFKEARISHRYFARYLLRNLEVTKKGVAEPEFVPSEDENTINLEHIIPENPSDGWKYISADMAGALYKRLGNMVLLQASQNTAVGNASFTDKKNYFKTSPYLLTSEVGEIQSTTWGETDVNKRQTELAKLAVQTWSV
jgi:hypothetical protein